LSTPHFLLPYSGVSCFLETGLIWYRGWVLEWYSAPGCGHSCMWITMNARH